MKENDRQALGAAGRQHVMTNYNFEEYGKKWVDLLTSVHEKYGSWENRKDYACWEAIKL